MEENQITQSCFLRGRARFGGCGARPATARLIRLETWSMNTRHARASRLRVDAGWATLRLSSAPRRVSRRETSGARGLGVRGRTFTRARRVCERRDATTRSCRDEPWTKPKPDIVLVDLVRLRPASVVGETVEVVPSPPFQSRLHAPGMHSSVITWLPAPRREDRQVRTNAHSGEAS